MGTTSLHGILRVVLGVCGVLALGAAVLLASVGQPLGAIWALGGAVILLLAVAYEHGRYVAAVRAGDRGRFQRTEEVFIDPTTGQRVRVWFDPATGERDYRPES